MFHQTCPPIKLLIEFAKHNINYRCCVQTLDSQIPSLICKRFLFLKFVYSNIRYRTFANPFVLSRSDSICHAESLQVQLFYLFSLCAW